MDNTYVKLYRSLLDHDTLSNDNNAYIVFTKLLMKVNRHTGTVRLGRFKLAAMTNLKPPTARDALKRLVRDSVVTVSTTPSYTDITICNWHDYQNSDDRSDDRSATQPRPKDDTITRTKKKNKNNNITPASADVVELFSYWKEQTGVEILSKLPTNQATCQKLTDIHGIETMRKLIRSVKQAQASKYAPRVSDFISLNARLTELLTWCKMQVQSPPPYQVGGAATVATKPPIGAAMTRKEMLEQEYAI